MGAEAALIPQPPLVASWAPPAQEEVETRAHHAKLCLCPARTRVGGGEGACGPESLETQLGAQGWSRPPGRTWALRAPKQLREGQVPVVTGSSSGHQPQGPWTGCSGWGGDPRLSDLHTRVHSWVATLGACSHDPLWELGAGAGHVLRPSLTQPGDLPPRSQLTTEAERKEASG